MADPRSSWEEQLIADLRANGGRPSQGPLKGHPLLLLWSIGAKSGRERCSILTYSRDGDDYVVAGTNSAAATDPAWIANVGAQPSVRLEVDNRAIEATARILAGEERDRAWQEHVAQLPWFGEYERQVTTRTIPVVRLTPR